VTAWTDSRRERGVLAAALARAEAWLLEPPEQDALSPAPPSHPVRPVVAVRGLGPDCGATTVARALAVALARGDPSGAAAVVGGLGAAGPRMANPACARLARRLAGMGYETIRTVGRLCILGGCEPLPPIAAERPCPVVVDVAHGAPPAEGLGVADQVILVGSPEIDSALAVAVGTSLARAGHGADLVLNRVADPAEVHAEAAGFGAAVAVIGESRLAAQLALACRGPRGPLAEPIADLAERCRARAVE
jgi:hypothetical protein